MEDEKEEQTWSIDVTGIWSNFTSHGTKVTGYMNLHIDEVTDTKEVDLLMDWGYWW